MFSIYINGIKKKVNFVVTILQVLLQFKLDIPRFCYHERLSIAGNCRMCMVEVFKSFKPVIACATPIAKDIQIFTETALVKNAREHVLEFLLINHPLDCPICDQGGECDLQDQTDVFGSDRGRFKEKKRSVKDKYFAPLIKTIMTRCIHCTRCVRFSVEVAQTFVLGLTGRGKNAEINTYASPTYVSTSILSGNLVDICPVGALTSKPYAFTARSWELKSYDSYDLLDALCTPIRIDVKGSEIMRILPRFNYDLNDEWITDTIRYCFDSLKKQRIVIPSIYINKHTLFISWVKAITLLQYIFFFNL